MYSSSYFKISSSLMCLLFMATFGFTNGEMIKWMNSPLPSNPFYENESIECEEDTVSKLSRCALDPIRSSEIENGKIEIFTQHLDLSARYKIHLTSTKNSSTSENPQKNAKFGAQMRGEKRGVRGYREMKGRQEMEDQFFEDLEIVSDKRIMQVFPNPAKDWITIYLPESINAKQLLLHDMTGTVVNDWTTGTDYSAAGLIKISTENISPGPYMLRIVGSDIEIKPVRVLIKK